MNRFLYLIWVLTFCRILCTLYIIGIENEELLCWADADREHRGESGLLLSSARSAPDTHHRCRQTCASALLTHFSYIRSVIRSSYIGIDCLLRGYSIYLTNSLAVCVYACSLCAFNIIVSNYLWDDTVEARMLNSAQSHSAQSAQSHSAPCSQSAQNGQSAKHELSQVDRERLREQYRHQARHRELFMSRVTETLPATYIRAKCHVYILNELECPLEYLHREVLPIHLFSSHLLIHLSTIFLFSSTCYRISHTSPLLSFFNLGNWWFDFWYFEILILSFFHTFRFRPLARFSNLQNAHIFQNFSFFYY